MDDCGQIKEGCAWDGLACLPEAVSELAEDASIDASYELDSGIANDLFVVQERSDGMVRAQPSLDMYHDAQTGENEAQVPVPPMVPPHATCQQSDPSDLYLLMLLIFSTRRLRPCS